MLPWGKKGGYYDFCFYVAFDRTLICPKITWEGNFGSCDNYFLSCNSAATEQLYAILWVSAMFHMSYFKYIQGWNDYSGGGI